MRAADREVLFENTLFLAGAGVHPELIADVLGVCRDSLSRLAERHGRRDVVAVLELDPLKERAWRGNWHDNGKVA